MKRIFMILIIRYNFEISEDDHPYSLSQMLTLNFAIANARLVTLARLGDKIKLTSILYLDILAFIKAQRRYREARELICSTEFTYEKSVTRFLLLLASAQSCQGVNASVQLLELEFLKNDLKFSGGPGVTVFFSAFSLRQVAKIRGRHSVSPLYSTTLCSMNWKRRLD